MTCDTVKVRAGMVRQEVHHQAFRQGQFQRKSETIEIRLRHCFPCIPFDKSTTWHQMAPLGWTHGVYLVQAITFDIGEGRWTMFHIDFQGFESTNLESELLVNEFRRYEFLVCSDVRRKQARILAVNLPL